VALGASRWRLTRQMLAESCMLALAGGILGVVFASVGVYLLLANIPAELPLPSFIKNIGLDWRVLGFTVLLSMVTGIIFGIFPALRASGVSPNSVLKEGERTNTVGYGQSRLRSTLIVAELALTMILLVAAGLLMKNVIQLQRTEPGLNSDNVLVMNISLPAAKYGQSDQKIAFYRETLERVRMLPGVNYAGVINNLPFRGWTGFNFTIEGRPALLPGQVPEANERVVSCGYFQAMGIPLLKGREFTDREGPDAEPVVMVNHAMVQRYFPNEDPIGRRIRPGGSDSSAPWYTIVGIVGDVLHFGLDKRPQAEIYKLNTQDPWLGMTLVVRTKSEPLGMASAVKQQIWSVDPEQPISGISDMTHVLSDSLWQARILTYIQGVFGVVALLMAAVGLYGVVSQSVTSRMHEFGVRVALGAERIDIFKLVLRQGLKLVFVGSVIGLIGAIVLTKSLTVVLRNISPTDPVVYIAITVFLAAVTLLACYIPARRAAKTDPMEALRYE
jgi:predicted permease